MFCILTEASGRRRKSSKKFHVTSLVLIFEWQTDRTRVIFGAVVRRGKWRFDEEEAEHKRGWWQLRQLT